MHGENLKLIKFNVYLSSGSWVVPCGQTDGWTWSKHSLFAILRTRLNMTQE